MKIKLLSTAVAAVLLSTTTAMANPSMLGQQTEMMQMLLQYDTDGDGMVSREEVEAAKEADFTSADIDGDTYLSWEEFQAFSESKQEERLTTSFSMMDADSSGDVSAEEFASVFADKSAYQTETVFGLLAGDDSSLSIDELAAMHNESDGKAMWKYASMDADEDGQISSEEYTQKPQRSSTTDTSSEAGEESRSTQRGGRSGGQRPSR